MAEEWLALLCLRGVVVLPGAVEPLRAGRAESLQALRAAGAGGRLVCIAQRDPNESRPDRSGLHEIGAIVRIRGLRETGEGALELLVEGLGRARLLAVDSGGPYPRGYVQPVASDAADAERVDALRSAYRRYQETAPGREDGAGSDVQPAAAGDPGLLADGLVARLSLSWEERQRYLETLDTNARLDRAVSLLNQEAAVRRLDRALEQKVRRRMEQRQREDVRRRPVRIIQADPGGAGDDAEELLERVQTAGLRGRAKEHVEREIRRLRQLPPASPESAVVRSYVELLLDLPWNRRAESLPDMVSAARLLDQAHYGLKEAKERILDHLAVRHWGGRDGFILCLAGPPGVGKTSLAGGGRALDRPFARVSLGGIRDEAEIRGHRRTYVGALPGRIIQAVRETGVNNPVLLLDEIDKLSGDPRGDPAAALLEVLDPVLSRQFRDHYLDAPFDLSGVLFIATANDAGSIPAPLLDRLELLPIHGYTEEEKLAIGSRHLLPALLSRYRLEPGQLRLSKAAMLRIVREYTREAGVRQLERLLTRLARKAVRRLLSSGNGLSVRADNLEKWLGRPPFPAAALAVKPPPGVVTGLGWTGYGGGIMRIEARVLPGRGGLTLTGRVGDVLQESARTALTCIRTRWRSLGLMESFLEDLDIHLHLPEGAVPKDGPSAGIALAAAMASALVGRPVPSGLAMTGEITLNGQVLPVGGIREKLLAARSGISKVIIPTANRPDLADLPAGVRRRLALCPAGSIDEVLDLALSEPVPDQGVLEAPWREGVWEEGAWREGSAARKPVSGAAAGD